MKQPLRAAVVATTWLLTLGIGESAAGQGVEVATANRVKVAYLYNFTRYVEWPDEAFKTESTPFVIGVLGADPFGRSLDRISKKRHQSKRPIVIQRFDTWQDESECHVLFLSSSVDPDERRKAISGSRNEPLLIVSDVGLTGPPPAPLNLYLDGDGTIGFEINVTETRLRGLKVNAKLLKLARVINTPVEATPQAGLSHQVLIRLAANESARSPLAGIESLNKQGGGR